MKLKRPKEIKKYFLENTVPVLPQLLQIVFLFFFALNISVVFAIRIKYAFFTNEFMTQHIIFQYNNFSMLALCFFVLAIIMQALIILNVNQAELEFLKNYKNIEKEIQKQEQSARGNFLA